MDIRDSYRKPAYVKKEKNKPTIIETMNGGDINISGVKISNIDNTNFLIFTILMCMCIYLKKNNDYMYLPESLYIRYVVISAMLFISLLFILQSIIGFTIINILMRIVNICILLFLLAISFIN